MHNGGLIITENTKSMAALRFFSIFITRAVSYMHLYPKHLILITSADK